VSDPYEQIGVKLKSAREAAGLEIAEAAAQAQIPRTAAEALEAEDFSNFPSPVYAKSFLTKYSELLGVDAKSWLDALAPGSFMAGGQAGGQVGGLLNGPETAPVRKDAAPEQRGGVLAVIVLMALTAAIVIGAIKGYEFFEKSFSDEAKKPVQEEPVAPSDVDDSNEP